MPLDINNRIIGPTTISAENTFTAPLFVPGGKGFEMLITGTAGSTVTLQKAPGAAEPQSSDFVDVNSFTAYKAYADVEPTGGWIRAGVKTGGFSTNAVITLKTAGNS